MNNTKRINKKIAKGFIFALVIFIIYSFMGFSNAYLTDTLKSTTSVQAASYIIKRVDFGNDDLLPEELAPGELYDLSIAYKNIGAAPADLHTALELFAEGEDNEEILSEIVLDCIKGESSRGEEFDRLTPGENCMTPMVENVQPGETIRFHFKFGLNDSTELTTIDGQMFGINISTQLRSLRSEDNNSWTSSTIDSKISTEALLKADNLYKFELIKDENRYEISGFNQSYINAILGGREPVKLTLPGAYNDKPVTSIAAEAFKNKGLVSVDIPNSITKIGARAFSKNEFKTITIPDSVLNIGDNAFYHKSPRSKILVNRIYDNDTDNTIRGMNFKDRIIKRRKETSTNNRQFRMSTSPTTNWGKWGEGSENTLDLEEGVMNIASMPEADSCQYSGILQQLNNYNKGEKYRVVITAKSKFKNSTAETIVHTKRRSGGDNSPQFNASLDLTNDYQTFYYEFTSSNKSLDKDMILHVGGTDCPYEIEVAEAYLEYIGPGSPSIGVPSEATRVTYNGKEINYLPDDGFAGDIESDEDITEYEIVEVIPEDSTEPDLDIEDEIRSEEELEIDAEEAVDKAEETKDQEYVEDTRDKVYNLPEGDKKDELNERLDKIQDEIDEGKEPKIPELDVDIEDNINRDPEENIDKDTEIEETS